MRSSCICLNEEKGVLDKLQLRELA
jgi:hypothetical protein